MTLIALAQPLRQEILTLSPTWAKCLRGLFLAASIGMHGLAVASFLPRPNDDEAPIEGFDLSIAPPEGETMVDEGDEVDSAAQAESVASIQKVEPPPPPIKQEEVEAAKVEDKDAEAIVAAVAPPVEQPPALEPPPPEQPPERPPEQVQTAPDSQAAAAAEETFARKAVGVENGLKTGGGVTRAAYAAAVKKEITKHRQRPSGYKHGTVSISFVIGAQGTPERVDVVKAANPTLDQTARRTIAAIHLPPPPGGSFMGTIAIRFE